MIIYQDNDNTVTDGPLTDDAGEFVNDATVTMTLKDAIGNAVTDALNLSLAYVTGSNGIYRGVISRPVAATLTTGAVYTLEITETRGDDDGFHALDIDVIERTS